MALIVCAVSDHTLIHGRGRDDKHSQDVSHCVISLVVRLRLFFRKSHGKIPVLTRVPHRVDRPLGRKNQIVITKKVQPRQRHPERVSRLYNPSIAAYLVAIQLPSSTASGPARADDANTLKPRVHFKMTCSPRVHFPGLQARNLPR